MKVAFTTLGCRVNQYETEAMTEKFKREGYEVTPFEEYADVYVVNTCTVTNIGDKKSRQMVSRARRKNEDAIIAVVGCYSQIAPEEVSKIEGVDVVLGTRNKGDIVYWVNRAREEKQKVIEVSDVLKNDVFENLNINEYQDRTRAFLKIQDGCNRFCSYCLIPFARGAVCSKEPEKVINEVKELAAHGFKEIILSGIHIASYGVDLKGDYNLLKILEEIDKVEGIERVRIGSIDPQFFTEGVIDKLSSLKKLCPHFHLSLQSGCDETLKRMNRRYTTKEYRNIVEGLRRSIRDVSITTDIIVGFPGEGEEEFSSTYEFLKDIKLSKMHIFKYSPRKGTKAAGMIEQINGKVKDERSNILIELDKELESEFMSKFIGRTMKVLYEQKQNGSDCLYEGYTPNYIKVVSKINSNVEEKIINTKLTEVKNGVIVGEFI
ncbi:tRNA (N(6)-L-threonylcarbamoyladenosine(37)-C(2))-methylthiotransferase MtaB [Clostridiaceae bacterium UIB06]|uniref:Threonylcarbamoyladenosine tRNA methylthiotransferase MtaB n=1 Tax=Clostridium thailandense TaxID=2794346 RepID=A0A949TY51_9CLOT|nr:tRNA (N(6)-L-threonylcarbamoyladenosine(37)-C(2))-methylthiotransferase MtaB [Clostridium thailandense]MBV7273028.1 tRNA (N(6)-L-threonylcarbamoyladenosine(37)-C(2))-methylthiotransferase MtaB [Clostridium thailandense]MCH5135692.1 tRNA (N(6)-L-threonylcarbamoyladenosine(37)-C(2))-methylthiotransferase MtaB [Clostridiaceae bacterium UIB06]